MTCDQIISKDNRLIGFICSDTIHEITCEKNKKHRFIYNSGTGLSVLNIDDSQKDWSKIPKSFWPVFDKWIKEKGILVNGRKSEPAMPREGLRSSGL